MKNGDKPVMPNNLHKNKTMNGITKREEFASRQMAALQAVCNGMVTDTSGIHYLAVIAIKQADALLAELEE